MYFSVKVLLLNKLFLQKNEKGHILGDLRHKKSIETKIDSTG